MKKVIFPSSCQNTLCMSSFSSCHWDTFNAVIFVIRTVTVIWCVCGTVRQDSYFYCKNVNKDIIEEGGVDVKLVVRKCFSEKDFKLLKTPK